MILPYVEQAFFDRIGDVAAESRADSVELTEALERETAARSALVDYRDNVSLQEALGMDSFTEGLIARQRAVEGATGAVERAKQTATGIDLPSVEHLAEVWPDLNPSERQRAARASD